MTSRQLAQQLMERCDAIAKCSEETHRVTRTFLSPPMREVHALTSHWMDNAGMAVRVDEAGNIRGLYAGRNTNAPRMLIGSHLDTVPNAGKYDGILGVMAAIALIEDLCGDHLDFPIEVIGFSEEEGVRFGIPFIGSRALIGTAEILLREQPEIGEAIRKFGLPPDQIASAALAGPIRGYLEVHIEQGPVLDVLSLPLGVVDAIAGQSRLDVQWGGTANHAGTTPMCLRRDALAGAAEWITVVEALARDTDGLLATVGRLVIDGGAGNVVPGRVQLSLDVRHANDRIRHRAVASLVEEANRIAAQRFLTLDITPLMDQAAVPMDAMLTSVLAEAIAETNAPVHRMVSGAGHDAMVLGARFPTAMLFLRSPGGISHHPDESVLVQDVEKMLEVGGCFLRRLEMQACPV